MFGFKYLLSVYVLDKYNVIILLNNIHFLKTKKCLIHANWPTSSQMSTFNFQHFYAMNLQHFFEMLEFNLWHLRKMSEYHYIKNARN